MQFEVPESIRQIADDPSRRTAWTFFVFFSRFEYALKMAGYLKRQDGRAEADWKRFAQHVSDRLDFGSSSDLRLAHEYYVTFPPKKQVVAKGKLRWCPCDPDSTCELDRLLALVRRVRNNLFHGGKLQGRPTDPSRDEALLTNALIVLRACVILDDQVFFHFNETPGD